MRVDRRQLLTGAVAAGAAAFARAEPPGEPPRPTGEELDRAAARPVLKTDAFKSPLVIDSIRLLKKDGDHFVHVRSKDGAEGLSLTNPPRELYLDKILKQLVIPFFIGKDARELEPLLWDLYRYKDNYKLQGLALWSPQAWVELAILDMLGRVAGRPMGALLGDIVRKDVSVYAASGKRAANATPRRRRRSTT
jgi:L-alanine-DL-glutamate epimerase-like enolase superfamily enzyme